MRTQREPAFEDYGSFFIVTSPLQNEGRSTTLSIHAVIEPRQIFREMLTLNEYDIDDRRKHVLLRLFFALGISIHSIYIVSFIINASVSFYILGWGSFYSSCCIASLVVIVNACLFRSNVKLIVTGIAAILFIALCLFTADDFHVETVDSSILKAIGLFNITVYISSLIFVPFRNHIENARLKESLKKMTQMNKLTGAYKRRFFNNYLDIEIRRNLSYIKNNLKGEINFAIAMIDTDDFKYVNDDFGHLSGDTMLTEILRIIKSELFEREHHLKVRW
jgi:predicted signal transduction protein with EAL and GGDEF domain